MLNGTTTVHSETYTFRTNLNGNLSLYREGETGRVLVDSLDSDRVSLYPCLVDFTRLYGTEVVVGWERIAHNCYRFFAK